MNIHEKCMFKFHGSGSNCMEIECFCEGCNTNIY